MGTLLDCRVENDFPQLEISEEISKGTQKKQKGKDKSKIMKNNLNLKEKRNKKNKKLNNIVNTTNNNEDDMIIINTDEEKSNYDKENKRNNNTKNNINNKDKKINNTIFINNSNVTISQRKEKKLTEELNEIKQDFNCYNSNDDNVELNEILNNVFNNNKVNSINYNTSNNRNLFTESDVDYNYSKEYFDQLYTEQSHIKLDINPRNENDEKIIKKLNKLKEKINNRNKPKEKNKKYNYKFEFNPVKVQRTITMTNKQIKNNIPSYRKNRGFFNSISFGKNNHFRKFREYNYSYMGYNSNTMGNSFNKSLYSSLMCDSVKDHFYNTHSNNLNCNINEDLYIRNSRKTPNIYSMHKSYFNNSSINQNSSSGINSQIKNSKNKSLYKVVSKKMKNKSKSTISQNKNPKIKENLIKFDLKKELENDEKKNNLLYHQYRDIIEIILPNNFNEESIVNNKIFDVYESNKNKVILNYNKLNNFKTSTLLYDGILYKVSDRKNKGFKLSKRYFQITKNCFRYYNSLEKAQKQEKPLVQFDIRHIKDLQIIENDFLLEYKIDNRDIEMVFCIYLNQNNDFFVFAVSNENLGKSVFDILSLLKHYYEDKK